jgi:hypothetical protein
VGVVLGDLYFVDPDPMPGQESPERGVRVEVRFVESKEVEGSIYAAIPILIGEPIWRLDLLESVDGEPGSFDRAHHHPLMRGYEPGARKFDKQLSSDPLGYLEARLRDLPGLLEQAELPADRASGEDLRQLELSLDAIVSATAEMLEQVRQGQLAQTAEPDSTGLARTGWL